MSETELDIQVAIETETPEIEIVINDEKNDVSIGIDSEIPDIQINVMGGEAEYDIYDGAYEVEPKFFEETTLQTKDKLTTQDVKIHEIRVQKVSSPTGGYVYYIGT